MRLSGKFSEWKISLAAATNGKSINANYKLIGSNNQEGVFTVSIAADEKIQQAPVDNSPGCKRFAGVIENTTYDQKGKVILEIKNIDNAGNISLYLVASDNLSGEGTLVGKIDADHVLQVSGLISGLPMNIAARVDQGRLYGNYILKVGSSEQKGTFDAKCTENGTANHPDKPIIKNPPNGQNKNPVLDQPNNAIGNGIINGSWKGTYTCIQGLTDLVLTLFTKDGTNVDGIFTFHLGDGANMSVLGSFKMKGTYDPSSGNIELKGVDWDQKPAGWEIGDISGKMNNAGTNVSGNVTKPALCTTFQLEKIKFQ